MKFQMRLVKAAVVAFSIAVAGCGGGGGSDTVVVGSVAVARLDIALSRPGPGAVRVDWSDDPVAASFAITRNGGDLAVGVNAASLVDSTVEFNLQYCYRVFGYDRSGQLVSASDDACIAG